MPRRQLEQALQSELGSNWREKVADFDYEAMAAASIGQVHAATLHDGRRVAMKIQCELAQAATNSCGQSSCIPVALLAASYLVLRSNIDEIYRLYHHVPCSQTHGMRDVML